ncbi:Tripartite [Paramecium bursaria]
MGNTPPLKLFQYKEYFIIEEFKEDYFPEMNQEEFNKFLLSFDIDTFFEFKSKQNDYLIDQLKLYDTMKGEQSKARFQLASIDLELNDTKLRQIFEKYKYYCSKCYNVWDDNTHKPILLKCGHTFCEQCITKMSSNQQINCPDDNQVTKLSQELQVNSEIMLPSFNLSNISPIKQNKEFPTSSSTFCQQHQSKQEYFCQDDNKYVCIYCVKESHYNHDIKNNSDLKYGIQNLIVSNQLGMIKSQLEFYQKEMQSKHETYIKVKESYIEKAYQIIQKQKRSALDQIQQKFSEIISNIHFQESVIILQLNDIVRKFQEEVRQKQIQNDQEMENNYNGVQTQINEMLLESNDKIGQMLTNYNSIQDQSKKVIQDYRQAELEQIEIQINKRLIVEFDDKIVKQMKDVCHFQFIEEQSRPSSMFKMIKQQMGNGNKQKSTKSIHQKSEDYNIVKDHFSSDRQLRRQITFGKMNDPKEMNNISPEKKRSPSNQRIFESRVLERIQELLDDGYSIEKLDLSNQSLGDRDINNLIENIKQSQSLIDSVKLAKNKISDYGFSQLIQLFSIKPSIHTLNLTGNLCTEKALSILEKWKYKLKGKTIYLNSCKINPQKCKQKQQELIDYGINLHI